EVFRLFAVSTLAPSFGVLPQRRTLILPLEPCEPKNMCRVWAALGCAERKAGVGAMRVLKRPSFGCLIPSRSELQFL
ncbi:hypothetical protein F5I97DRAFT_1812967, partial [Phlebopus sp. FC_14]